MKWSIGLHIGEHLLEVSATNGKEWKEKRAFGVAAALDQALAKFLEENQIDNIANLNVSTTYPRRLFEKSYVSPCAVLTTAGFETLLELTIPATDICYTTQPTRIRPPFERDYIFGVSERTSANGEVSAAIKAEELDFLASKLDLSGIKNVAVCFLHSNANAENETAAKTMLEEKGFQVFLSSEHNCTDPGRFWAAIWAASVMPLFKERLQTLMSAFGERLKGNANVLEFGPIHPEISSGTLAKASWALTNRLAERHGLTSDLLYCGLERWTMVIAGCKRAEQWLSPFGEVATSHITAFDMFPQPLSPIQKGTISDAALLTETLGYDIGPVIFGRSLNPTFVDLLIDRKLWPEISGFSERSHERGQRRLDEALTTYSKALSDSSKNIERDEFVNEILASAARSLNMTINRHRQSEQLILCGPAADAVESLLKMTPMNFNLDKIGTEFFGTREICARLDV